MLSALILLTSRAPYHPAVELFLSTETCPLNKAFLRHGSNVKYLIRISDKLVCGLTRLGAPP